MRCLVSRGERALASVCAASLCRCPPPRQLPSPYAVAAFSTGMGTVAEAAAPSHPSGLTLLGTGAGMGLTDIQPSRAPLFKTSPLTRHFQRYYYLMKAMMVFSVKATIGVNSEAIYRSIEEQATQDVWYEALGLPRNWITENALIALHVWMFHNKFKVEYNISGEFSGRRMQEQVFERFWEDTTVRIRNAGVAEISVNKQLENVQKITFDDMFGYDAAIKIADDDNMELAAAIWKGVFREAEGANTEAVLKLADYVRREVYGIMLQPKEDVYRGWITWGPCVGETETQRLERQRRLFEGEWREALHLDGRVYFYHTASGETQWEPPAEGLYERRRFALKQFFAAREQKAAIPAAAAAAKALNK